jgi:hypothetical protein
MLSRAAIQRLAAMPEALSAPSLPACVLPCTSAVKGHSGNCALDWRSAAPWPPPWQQVLVSSLRDGALAAGFAERARLAEAAAPGAGAASGRSTGADAAIDASISIASGVFPAWIRVFFPWISAPAPPRRADSTRAAIRTLNCRSRLRFSWLGPASALESRSPSLVRPTPPGGVLQHQPARSPTAASPPSA